MNGALRRGRGDGTLDNFFSLDDRFCQAALNKALSFGRLCVVNVANLPIKKLPGHARKQLDFHKALAGPLGPASLSSVQIGLRVQQDANRAGIE